MTRIHWVTRQNKLETPTEKDEVNKREVHEDNGRPRDPDTMVAPPTPNPTRKSEALTRASSTITSSCGENTPLWKWQIDHGYVPRGEIQRLFIQGCLL